MKNNPRTHHAILLLLLLLQAMLGFGSLLTDSVTFDELAHFTAGVSYWQTRDFRLDPENPPLMQYWSTLPLQFMRHAPIPTDSDAWRRGAQWEVARDWFCRRANGERLLVFGRVQVLAVLLALTWTIYAVTRQALGPGAALLAAAVAALWPSLLAHGRLVTSDVPIALFTLLSLWRLSRLLHGPTLWRWLSAALACAGLALVKFSFVLVLPALVAVWITSLFAARCSPPMAGRARQVIVRNALLTASLLLSTWSAVWIAYGTRFTMFADDVADIESLPDADARLQKRRYWLQMLTVAAEQRNQVWLPFVIETLEAWRVLPEAYLFGFTYTLHSTHHRDAFLMGNYSEHGWWYYFPVAFALKTPLPIQALLLCAVGLLSARVASARSMVPARRGGRRSSVASAVPGRRRVPPASAWGTDQNAERPPANHAREQPRPDPNPRGSPSHLPLLIGLLTFAAAYLTTTLTSRINIGERHLIPLYPLVCIAIGAVAWSWRTRTGRWFTGAAFAWLAVGAVAAFPHYIGYKNELLWGRPLHEYLADSNVDWGQDLKRLAAHAQAHPDDSIQLSYFGRVDPTTYLPCFDLAGYQAFIPASALAAGTYVVSATQLVGVYDPLMRPETWQRAEVRRAYKEMGSLASTPLRADAPPEIRKQHAAAVAEFPRLRTRLLISRLRHRKPDDRVGTSMFVYRLSDAELATLTHVP